MRDKLITLLCWLLARLFDLSRRAWKPSPIIGRYHKGQEVAPDARLVRRTATGVPGNIVIIKPCCLGDAVLSSAAVADLRAAFPNAFITYAVGDWARPAVAHNPRIDTVVRWEGISPERSLPLAGQRHRGTEGGKREIVRRGRGKYLGEIKEVWERVERVREGVAKNRAALRMLRNGRYDCVVMLDRSPVLGLLAWLAGVPVRVGVDSQHRGFAHNLRVPLLSAPEHEADLYRRVAVALADQYSGLAPDGLMQHQDPSHSGLEFYPSNEAKQVVAATLARLNPQARPVVLVHPGGGVNPANAVLAKRWPAERFAAIIARLFNNAQPLVFITGNAADSYDAARLMAELVRIRPDLRQSPLADADARTDVVACIEAFDIDTLGALCAHAALFVGNDTGLMHIATAQGVGIVAVFGPSDPRMYGPYHPVCGGWVAPDTNAQWGRRLEEYRALSVEAGGIAEITADAVWAKVEACLPIKPR